MDDRLLPESEILIKQKVFLPILSSGFEGLLNLYIRTGADGKSIGVFGAITLTYL